MDETDWQARTALGSNDLPPENWSTDTESPRREWIPRRTGCAGAGLRRSRLVGVLKEHEAGAATAALCRQHGISEQTFSRWKQKYSGLERGEATRLKALEEENARLKRLVAEQALDNQILKDLLRKNA